MTRFVIDADVALRVAAGEVEVAPGHELLAPTLMRSQALSLMHEAVARGDLSAEVARDRLDRLNRVPIRLLGDAVLRRVAWQIADSLGSSSTYDAEYLALTRLQADFFVTLSEDRARAAEGIVPVAPPDAMAS